MSDLTCSTCQFSNITAMGDGPVLECRRFPPQIISFFPTEKTDHPELGGAFEPAVVWPQVSALDWCGEYNPKFGSDRHE